MRITPTNIKVTLLIPLKDNDGEPFDLATWSWWNDELTALVSGLYRFRCGHRLVARLLGSQSRHRDHCEDDA